MKANLIRAIVGALVLALAPPGVLHAQGTAPPPSVQGTTRPPPAPAASEYRPAQLDQVLAPVALYPDALLGQILMASTYPLEVVEAARWVQEPKNASLKGDQLAAALQDQNWDPSVKSLVPFPDILRMMNDQLAWMENLGDAFLAQQADVMDSVQRLRREAQQAGTLKSSPQQAVSAEGQSIVIQPANPDVVYVPVYDPTVVFGAWPYPDYPPFYFWPPGFVFGPAYFPGWWWWPPIDIGFFGPFWGWDYCDWGHHWIGIDHGRYDRIAGNHRPFSGNTWQHDPYHRRGVAYRDPATAARFGRPTGTPDARRAYRGYEAPPGATAPRGGRTPSAIQPGASPGQPGMSRGTTAPGTPRSNPTLERAPASAPLFGSYGRGSDVRTQSERGRASQQSSAPRGPSPSVSAPHAYGGATGGGRPSGGGGGGRSSGGGTPHR